MTNAIRIQNLSKRYRLGASGGLGSMIRSLRRDAAPKELWALRDVSFDVAPGEAIGIIGHNGAGKSTLLKVLSRITEPTHGRVELRGRVASLLEVGTGFHPELSGRENIYLNGAILGMARREISSKFDEIVDFSGVETFLDTPVKRYSSGMRVRLAFAVAAHLEPEILIVDEVLAVGDAEFQSRCLGRMGQLAKDGGRTVLFVSHQLAAVRSLCRRAVLMEQGRVEEIGAAADVVGRYVGRQFASVGQHHTASLANAEVVDRRVELIEARLQDESGEPRAAFAASEAFCIAITHRLVAPVPNLRVVMQLHTAEGEIAFTTTDDSARVGDPTGVQVSTCRVPGNLLNIGEYVVRIWAGRAGVGPLANAGDCLRLQIQGVASHGSRYVESRMPGVVAPQVEWTFARQVDGEGLERSAA